MRCSKAGISSSRSVILTVRFSRVRGIRRNLMLLITPKRPYPPIASLNNSAIGRPATLYFRSFRRDEFERFNVLNKGPHGQSAAMHIGSEPASQRQCICASLLLNDAPGLRIALFVHSSKNQ